MNSVNNSIFNGVAEAKRVKIVYFNSSGKTVDIGVVASVRDAMFVFLNHENRFPQIDNGRLILYSNKEQNIKGYSYSVVEGELDSLFYIRDYLLRSNESSPFEVEAFYLQFNNEHHYINSLLRLRL